MAAKKYKLNQGFVTQKLKDKIVIFSGERSLLFTLNDTAAFIYNGIKLGWDEEKIIKSICVKFDVNESRAGKDVNECIKDLIKKNILQESKPNQ